MNGFIIVDGLPYSYVDGKAYQVRWNEEGFTAGAEVELTAAPETVYTELSILAQCAGHLDSIRGAEPVAQKAFNDMTVAELKAYAAEAGVDLGTAKAKADIIAAITDVLV